MKKTYYHIENNLPCLMGKRYKIYNYSSIVVIFLCACFLLGIIPVGYTQEVKEDKGELWKADNLQYHRAYNMALELYQNLYKQDKYDPLIHLRLAETYSLLDKPEESSKWYELVLKDTLARPIHQFQYAQQLCKSKRYIRAERYFESYQQEVIAEGERLKKIVNPSHLPFFLFDSSSAYVIERLPINSMGADFSPTLFKNGLIYVSTRGQDLTIDAIRRNHTEEAAYFDLYFCAFDRGRISKPVEFHKNVNSYLHEGPLSIFNNSRNMIFTRNYFNRKQGKQGKQDNVHFGTLRLYSMLLNEDGTPDWEHPKMLPFSDEGVSYGHPSTDGKVLYFVSNMPGGAGKTDIYRATFKKGRWSIPRNMGPLINSEGSELFPYLAPDGMLYFASDGLGGMGGLDIYRVDPGSYEESPVNLGYPLNTPMDDFGFVLDASGQAGYLCSNRTRGGDNDDIYRFYPLNQDSLYRVADSLSTISATMDYISTSDSKAIGVTERSQEGYNDTTNTPQNSSNSPGYPSTDASKSEGAATPDENAKRQSSPKKE